jgi:adenylosuccinate lyase
MSNLLNITPIDGRYAKVCQNLQEYFSEFALIKHRIEIEIEYLIALHEEPTLKLNALNDNEISKLRGIYLNFNIEQAQKVKDIEQITNHDVKAVEYFIKEQVDDLNININKELIHFGLTSQDINNTSFPLMLKRFLNHIFIPKIEDVVHHISDLAKEWKDQTIIAKTHGQPASPTTLGKELWVFVERISIQLDILKDAKHTAKFGGATGNLNAHKISFPETNWILFANNFVAHLGLERQQTTTQIEHYDGMAHIFDTIKRIDNIFIDLCRDIWSYVSFDFFKQKIKENEVGSSAMPHKVNPIDFENAEGNLMMANAVFEFLSSKLPISRLQRDLTDSTVLRNIGVPFSHTFIALNSIEKGLGKLLLNQDKINQDIEANWIVIAEAIQNLLRIHGVDKPYELLKDFSRKNNKPNQADFELFIDGLKIEEHLKLQLKQITPYTYIGYSNILNTNK